MANVKKKQCIDDMNLKSKLSQNESVGEINRHSQLEALEWSEANDPCLNANNTAEIVFSLQTRDSPTNFKKSVTFKSFYRVTWDKRNQIDYVRISTKPG